MKYRCVTLWHKNDTGEYERTIYDRATVSKCDFAKVLGGSITKGTQITIRIFTNKCPDISVGDRISDNYEIYDFPTENAYIVKEIKNNMNASSKLRHYRIECV